MSTTAGALSVVSLGSTSNSVLSAVATGGTGPYTYQWYRSLVAGFTQGPSNILVGATSLALTDTGLIPGTQYYYGVIASDVNAVAGSSAILAALTTQPVLSPNQFNLVPFLGQTDLKFNGDTIAVEIDQSSAACFPGQGVTFVDSVDGIPKVLAATANSDNAAGFINYDIKSKKFSPGDRCEISMSGNVMYLYATGAIARMAQVSLDITTVGGVRSAAGHTGDRIVGFAIDKAVTAGTLIRVKLITPSFAVV